LPILCNDNEEANMSKKNKIIIMLTAAQLARGCPKFKLDVEEEIVADETVSCYNCRFRKWTDISFVCFKL
jgi:hypothetical protein